MIYFITAREIARVKIGISADPAARLLNLQSASPVELCLERVCEGDRNDEIKLHSKFACSRVRGEWFAITAEIEAHMATLPAFIKRRGGTLCGIDPLARWLRDAGVTQKDLAARCGFHGSYLTKIRSGFHGINAERAGQIEAATGGEVTAEQLFALRKRAA